MSGTINGGKKAAKTNKERHGKDFYREAGRLGGQVTGVKKGFASGKLCYCDLVKGGHTYPRCAGKKGGMKSKRSKDTFKPKAPVVLEDNGGVEPTPYNGFKPATEKKKKLWIF